MHMQNHLEVPALSSSLQVVLARLHPRLRAQVEGAAQVSNRGQIHRSLRRPLPCLRAQVEKVSQAPHRDLILLPSGRPLPQMMGRYRPLTEMPAMRSFNADRGGDSIREVRVVHDMLS